MVWQVVRRSLISLVGVCTFLTICGLIANAAPDPFGPIIVMTAGVIVFTSVIILVGWVGQGCMPTDPQGPPRRRLRSVATVDEPNNGTGQTADGGPGVRKAA